MVLLNVKECAVVSVGANCICSNWIAIGMIKWWGGVEKESMAECRVYCCEEVGSAYYSYGAQGPARCEAQSISYVQVAGGTLGAASSALMLYKSFRSIGRRDRQ